MRELKSILRYSMFLLTVGILLISGCAGKGRQPESVKVSLVGIKAQEVKLFETSLKVSLRIFNLSDFPIEIKGTECKIEITGQPFAFGVSDQQMSIPAFGSAVVPIVVYSSVIDMVKNLMNLSEKERLEYRIAGKLHLEQQQQHLSNISFETSGLLFSSEIQP